MNFVREDRSIPLSLWGTENMLEYFRAMRDMSYGEFLHTHGFWPMWVQVAVVPQNKAVRFVAETDETNKKALSKIIELIEGLGEPYQLWGNASVVAADEFERELTVLINTDVVLDEVHAEINVSEPMGHNRDTDIRLVLSGLSEMDRDDIVSVLDWQEPEIDFCTSITLGQLLVIRGYIADAMARGRFMHVNDGDEGLLDGWVHFVDGGQWGTIWPTRGMEGYLSLCTLWLGDVETSRLYKWEFIGEVHDASVRGKIEYRFDLAFQDDNDTYVVHKGFINGTVDAPSWWDEYMTYDEDDDD